MKPNMMKRAIKFVVVLGMISLISSGCANPPAAVEPTLVPTVTPANGKYWPTEAWRSSTPEEQSMDSQKLAQMVATINEKKIAVHSLLVIRHGYLVSETYFGSYKQDTKHDLQSVGRSWTSVLIGIAIDKGNIDGVDHRILDYFPGRTIANLDRQKKDMTLEDLLTMRTGFEWQEVDGAFEKMQKSPDWVQYILDMPMAEAPGSRWNYCSICSHLLTAILQKTTGINPRDFAEQNLFKPLGITGVAWMADPAGVPLGAGGFRLTPRDMAKLGYLYLRNGEWDGEQIVSSRWVKSSTQKYADIDEHFGYGYHWVTVKSMGGFVAVGGGGQIILVVPASDLVVVTTANTQESIFGLIEQYVLPAVQKSE